jgi:hypothetical protein
MSSRKFTRDLKQGNFYEKKALDYFKWDKYTMSKGYFKEYDIKILDEEGNETKIEVKSDRLSSKTGNLCIEHKYKNKPSGIDATTADYWVYFVLYGKGGNIYADVEREECYVIPTKDLKELVQGCRSVWGGDGYNSQLYLLSKSQCSKYLKKITKKEEDCLVKGCYKK